MRHVAAPSVIWSLLSVTANTAYATANACASNYIRLVPTSSMPVIEEDVLLLLNIQSLSMSQARYHRPKAELDIIPGHNDTAPNTDLTAAAVMSTTNSETSSKRAEEKTAIPEAKNGFDRSKDVNKTNKPNPDSKNQLEEANTKSHTPDWVPRCPHCGTANEYGQVMYDAVLPRVCQGGDHSSEDEKVNERDAVWYEMISKII